MLTRHLHDFVREAAPSIEEWNAAIAFLTEVGRLVHRHPAGVHPALRRTRVSRCSSRRSTARTGGTESTVLGPVPHDRVAAAELGDSIDLVGGQPEPAWSPVGPKHHRRAAGRSDASTCGSAPRTASTTSSSPTPSQPATGAACSDGRVGPVLVPLRSCRRHYPIPTDGPVGGLLGATARHPYRPAHVHFHRLRRRTRGGHHPRVRRWQRLHRLRRGVRGSRRHLIVDFARARTDADLAAELRRRGAVRARRFDVVLPERS